jgi:TRAP-type C4-dicarboxylate transport system substrate-binding protein
MVDRIAERTDGNFTIVHHFGGELGIDYAEHPTALSDRVVDLATVSTGHSSGILPWIGIFQRPLLCKWPEDFYALAQAVRPVMERELSELDITPTAFYAIDPVSVWTVPEVDSPTDMGGIKIRAWDEASAAVGRALGADPQVMGFYDVYPALQRGVVDGGITGSAAVASASWYEFVKHGYLVGLPPNTYYLAYNNEAFNELPPEYQVILLEELHRMSDLHLKKSPAEFRNINQILIDNGVTLHEVSDSDRAIIASRLTPLWQEWADAGGPVAQELLDVALDVLGITM